MNANWSPESQGELYQQGYPHCEEWSRVEEYQDFQSYTEPYPTFIQIPSLSKEYLPDPPYPDHQDHDFDPPTYQTDCFSYFLSHSSHLYQTFSSEIGDYCQTWSNKDWQTQDTPYYPDQTCPDQPQYQPHPLQSLEPTLEEDHYADSAEGEIEGATVFQQNEQNSTRSETEMVMEMRHTYGEQQSNLDNMIRQVALLTEIIGEMKKSRAEPEVDWKNEEEEGVIVTTEGG